ncbi:plasmid pRiA4b ORF-3 family protein [Aquibacillus sediminis]|uniref:plasmid pRiA4b ORF-3 family protein n=1 Tax=Aquibacillus sediminis TaxID=2574734 RepID=UPI0011080A80|nr:plasmid pRiA4b ORF-3 family protein [Aquibacillus sediminis]
MLVQCTKKLLDQLKRKPETVEDEEPLVSWHANFLTLNRRKTVVLVNDQNRYTIVLHGLKAKDFNNIDDIIVQAIYNTFEQEWIRKEVIDQYIESSKGIAFSKTKNRTLVARMNKACETVYWFQDLLDPDTIFQPTLSLKVSRDLVGVGNNDYFHPNKEMYKDLQALVGKPIIQTKAAEMTVTLRLENFHVFRRLIVPMNFSFLQLHKTLQIAFNWKDNHLHEFYVFDNNHTNQPFSYYDPTSDKEGFNPILNLVSNQEAFHYGNDDIPMKMDNQVLLKEYLPTNVTYVYDFGDAWIHDIKIERVIEDYDKNHPTCLEGEGKTPPEDVGGEPGYENFLEILADESHPDYNHMRIWSSGLSYQDFNLELVNRGLSHV